MEHIVITVIRDEEDFVRDLIKSMTEQTFLPKKWIFVDNFSEDSTPEIIREAISKYDWIELIENKGSKEEAGAKISQSCSKQELKAAREIGNSARKLMPIWSCP